MLLRINRNSLSEDLNFIREDTPYGHAFGNPYLEPPSLKSCIRPSSWMSALPSFRVNQLLKRICQTVLTDQKSRCHYLQTSQQWLLPLLTGLSRAFLAAGAACVIVTLWKINDRSACGLMTAFYREYKASRDAAVSLQKAMKILQAKDDTRSPQHWAAFSVVGVTGVQIFQH